ncbi:hypothetical protein [Spirosoma gilvum]
MKASVTFLFLIALTFLLRFTTTQAQSVKGGAGFIYLGSSQWPGASAAIHQLNQGVSPNTSNQYLLVGGDLYWRSNRWLVGAGISALANKHFEPSTGGAMVESSASNAHIWMGWIAWQNHRTKLYPSLGPGINSFNINVQPTAGSLRTYTHDGFSTDLALTLDWLMSGKTPDKTLQAGPMLSLKIGYRLTTASAEWHSDLSDPIITTRYSPSCFYLTLGFGGGGFRVH